MKRLIVSLVFLFILIGLSGCYTILQTSEEYYEEPEVIVYYPVPIPVPPPEPGTFPLPVPPNPPPKHPDPQPIIRQPENPNHSGGSGNEIRDPLRNGGGRGNHERNPEQVYKPERNDGGRR